MGWKLLLQKHLVVMKGDLNVMSGFLADIGQLFDMTLGSNDVVGIILNPYGDMLTINKQIISV